MLRRNSDGNLRSRLGSDAKKIVPEDGTSSKGKGSKSSKARRASGAGGAPSRELQRAKSHGSKARRASTDEADSTPEDASAAGEDSAQEAPTE